MKDPKTDDDLTVVPKHASTGYSGQPRDFFTLQDGDKIGDVVFEAGQYTLEQIVERCNRYSLTYVARLESGLVKLRQKVRHLATKHLTNVPPEPRNRHERRKAAALARRAGV